MNISDKVVCVDDTPIPTQRKSTIHDYWMPDGMIRKGEVYCVSGVIHHPTTGLTGIVIVGKPLMGRGADGSFSKETGWSPHRFRKLGEVRLSNSHSRVVRKPVLLPAPVRESEHSVVPRVLARTVIPGVNAPIGMALVAGIAPAVRNCRRSIRP